MSTKMSARGIVGSLRLLGVTAAVAVGLAVSVAPASAADSAAQGDVPAKACDNMMRAGVPMDVLVKHDCLVDVPDEGEITDGSIFG